MEQYRRLLYCARFFAAAALIFYFVTSCTNYWLHAITCRTVNDTLEDESPPVRAEFGMLRGSPKPPTESVDNTTDLRSGTVSTVSTETFNGSPKSSGKEAVLPRNVPTPRRKCKRPKGRKGCCLSCFGGHTPLALEDYRLNYHHEGFFWRCSFSDKEEKYQLRKFIYIYQPPLKCCVHAFHSPFPNVEGRTTKEFESSISYRKLWSALMFLGVTFVTIGFLCIIYSACCENYNMYKTTGVIFLIADITRSKTWALCNWIIDFLIRTQQSVHIRNNISSLLTINTDTPQRYMFSLLLYSLYNHDCVARYSLNACYKFVMTPLLSKFKMVMRRHPGAR
ncbi:uncharacterized protein LOC132391345 isoform X2 [Hypanus sabinus]|uniref:uncharacterized protein LOC132391345 isoform X2 n=1 Tax=Hypanus sabinus TaxID=79690 RepID=UPI0028C42720|nr:uncharacterized protein LOC132391345 isoform X2 [Hypanus sabinus]